MTYTTNNPVPFQDWVTSHSLGAAQKAIKSTHYTEWIFIDLITLSLFHIYNIQYFLIGANLYTTKVHPDRACSSEFRHVQASRAPCCNYLIGKATVKGEQPYYCRAIRFSWNRYCYGN